MMRAADRMIAAARAFAGTEGREGIAARLVRALARRRLRLWQTIAGCDVGPGARIGPGLNLPHPNGVVIHHEALIGRDCMLMQQVTIGQLGVAGAPVLGDNVYVGCGAKILGPITIGDGARIGANAVVLHDVPAGATAVGIPARIVVRSPDATASIMPAA